MDSLSILKSLVGYVEQWREAWPKVGRMKGFGKTYEVYYDLNTMVHSKYIELKWIVDTVLYYLFQDVDVRIKKYSYDEGYINDAEINEYIRHFMYDIFSCNYSDIHDKKIDLVSEEEYLNYLISLEEKYRVNSFNIEKYKNDIQKAEIIIKHEEEQLKKMKEEAEKIKKNFEKEIVLENQLYALFNISTKKQEVDDAFEMEVQRRVKLELYERRIRAEVERRLKEYDSLMVEKESSNIIEHKESDEIIQKMDNSKKKKIINTDGGSDLKTKEVSEKIAIANYRRFSYIFKSINKSMIQWYNNYRGPDADVDDDIKFTYKDMGEYYEFNIENTKLWRISKEKKNTYISYLREWRP